MNPRPGVLQFTADWTQDAEALAYLSEQQKTGIRGNLDPLKDRS